MGVVGLPLSVTLVPGAQVTNGVQAAALVPLEKLSGGQAEHAWFCALVPTVETYWPAVHGV